MTIQKDYVIDYVSKNCSEQYKTDPLFHMAIDKILYTGGCYACAGDFVEVISELCKFKHDETQFQVDMEYVQNLLSGYLKDYEKRKIL